MEKKHNLTICYAFYKRVALDTKAHKVKLEGWKKHDMQKVTKRAG
jgi:hypothetical protein